MVGCLCYYVIPRNWVIYPPMTSESVCCFSMSCFYNNSHWTWSCVGIYVNVISYNDETNEFSVQNFGEHKFSMLRTQSSGPQKCCEPCGLCCLSTFYLQPFCFVTYSMILQLGYNLLKVWAQTSQWIAVEQSLKLREHVACQEGQHTTAECTRTCQLWHIPRRHDSQSDGSASSKGS